MKVLLLCNVQCSVQRHMKSVRSSTAVFKVADLQGNDPVFSLVFWFPFLFLNLGFCQSRPQTVSKIDCVSMALVLFKIITFEDHEDQSWCAMRDAATAATVPGNVQAMARPGESQNMSKNGLGCNLK